MPKGRSTAPPAPDLVLRIPSKRVTLDQLNRVLDTWSNLLSEVGSEVAGTKRSAVDYVITKARVGSMTLAVAAESRDPGAVPKRTLPKIGSAVTKGLALLARRSQRPKFFSDAALERVKELSDHLNERMPAIHLVKGNRTEVAVTKQTAVHVQEILGPRYESIGSVEGLLEGLIIHGRPRCLIFDHLTGRQVTCYFTNRVSWNEAVGAFGKRLIATGVVRSRKTGEKLSIEVSHLRVLPAESDLPTPEDVLGILRGHG